MRLDDGGGGGGGSVSESEEEEAECEAAGGSGSVRATPTGLKRSEVTIIFGESGAALEQQTPKFFAAASKALRSSVLRDAAFSRTSAPGGRVVVQLQRGWEIIPGHNMVGTFSEDRRPFRAGMGGYHAPLPLVHLL